MTSPENLGKQFEGYIPIYRGLSQTDAKEVVANPNRLGIHWSKDLNIADEFARDEDHAEDLGETPRGVVIHGLVHPKHIVDPNSKEFDNMADFEGILGPESREREATIRPGGEVHVTDIEEYNDDTQREPKRTGIKFKGQA